PARGRPGPTASRLPRGHRAPQPGALEIRRNRGADGPLQRGGPHAVEPRPRETGPPDGGPLMTTQQAMASNGSGMASSGDAELSRVLETYLADLEAGRAVDRDQLLAEHPAIADRLRACLASLHLVAQGSRVFGPERRGVADQGPALGQLGDFHIVREIGR